MTATNLLTPLLHSVRLPELAEALQQTLTEEQVRREHFHATMDDSMKAEFINGEVIMHSPARYRHLQTLKFILRIIDTYVDHNQLGVVTTEKTLIRLPRNSYEPDLCYFRLELAEHFTPEQMLFPAPDLVVEVLSSATEDKDRGIKMEDYSAHGVKEYWIVDPELETIEQYLVGPNAEFVLARKMDSGELPCSVLPDLRFPVRAAFDRAANRECMKGLWQRG